MKNWFGIFFCVVSIVACTVAANGEEVQDDSEDSCVRFSSFIAEKEVNSIDELLEAMSRSVEWSEFLKSYTFVFRSKSLQQATPTNPRAVVYGKDAKLIFTFLGRPDKNGRDTLEVSCWRPQKNAFEYFELASNGKILTSLTPQNANPRSCLRCHGSDPRPNWDAYNFWPGTYGSLERAGCGVSRMNKPEYKFYRGFLAKSRYKGRYAFLPNEVAPKNGYDDVCPSDLNRVVRTIRNGENASPNADLLDRIQTLNVKRVARIVRQVPQFEKFRYALQAIVADYDVKGFFPHNLLEQFPFEQFEDEVLKTIKFEFQKRLGDFNKFNGADPTSESRRPIDFLSRSDYLPIPFLEGRKMARIFYVLALLGVETDRLSTAFDSGTYDFTLGRGSFWSEVVFRIWPETRQPYEDLMQASLDSLHDFAPANKVIRPHLLARSGGTNVKPLTPVEKAQTFSLLQTTCNECHGISEADLPFNSESQLRGELQGRPEFSENLKNRILGINLKGRSQMPYKSPFSIDLQMRIVDYLEQLGTEK